MNLRLEVRLSYLGAFIHELKTSKCQPENVVTDPQNPAQDIDISNAIRGSGNKPVVSAVYNGA